MILESFFNQRALIGAVAFASLSAVAQAGDFTRLPTAASGAPIERLEGDPVDDPFLLPTGTRLTAPGVRPVIYDLPSYLQVVAQRSTTVFEDDNPTEEIGTFTDFVFKIVAPEAIAGTNIADFNGKYVFGSRMVLSNDEWEFNDIFRRGYSPFDDVYAGWTRMTSRDDRMRSAARTSDSGVGGGVNTYDPDTVAVQADLNIAEGVPSSGLFLVLVPDAVDFRLQDEAVELFQAGEEDQLPTRFDFAGYVPVPVPEPSTYAMLLGGLGLLGAVARRRRGA